MTDQQGGADVRHEIKFAAYVTEVPAIRHWLQLHPEAFRQPFPDRQVNNVYFDTWDYRAYAENLAGVSDRAKLRYRWYGDSAGPDAGVLEVKHKRNYFGWKDRYPVNTPPWQEGATWEQVRAAIRAELPFPGQLWFDQNPLPIMLNRYQRQYFCSSDQALRVTIDTEQRVCDQRAGQKPNLHRAAIMQDTTVVEFKFAREDRQRAVKMLDHFPIRVSRHSKYMNAVRAVGMV